MESGEGEGKEEWGKGKNEDETSLGRTSKKRRGTVSHRKNEAYETSVLINDRNSLYTHHLLDLAF